MSKQAELESDVEKSTTQLMIVIADAKEATKYDRKMRATCVSVANAMLNTIEQYHSLLEYWVEKNKATTQPPGNALLLNAMQEAEDQFLKKELAYKQEISALKLKLLLKKANS